MIAHSKSFETLKAEVQRAFDFAILSVHAVPWLKYSIKEHKIDLSKPLPFRPDYFDERPVASAKVVSSAQCYKAVLAKHLFLSSFSYFEAYFHNLVREVLEFHGVETLLEGSKPSGGLTAENEALKRKLQEYRKRQTDPRLMVL